MPRSALTGSRIRERRMLIGMRQTDLARAAGVSAAYLNLIEHNRRRVGPELVGRLAGVLGVGAEALAEAGESPLIEALREAAAEAGAAPAGRPQAAPGPELDRIEELTVRFPGWAGRLAERQGRVAALERQLAALSERLSHDPFLSSALHEVLSVVTSVRSTAAILADGEGIAPEVQARFHRNLHDDSLRLSRAAAALVGYLDRAEDAAEAPGGPQDAFETWLGGQGWHLAALEVPETADPPALVQGAGLAGAARDLALAHVRQAAADAAAMPLGPFLHLAREADFDPARIAGRGRLPQAAVFRRLAALPAAPDIPAFGLAVCDGSGALVFRRPLPGFAPPRQGAGCPLWPLYEALSRPGVPIRRRIEVAGRVPRLFLADAWCETHHPEGAGGPQLAQSLMLMRALPEVPGRAARPGRSDDAAGGAGPVLPVGGVCRICPRDSCAARREPSILEDFTAGTAGGQMAFDRQSGDGR